MESERKRVKSWWEGGETGKRRRRKVGREKLHSVCQLV